MTARGAVAVLGAGGHAKVVISTLQASGIPILGVFDDAQEKWGQYLLGVKVLGPLANLASMDAIPAVCAVGSNAIRKSMVDSFAWLNWICLVHPQAVVHPSATIGPGSVVFAGAIVQPDAVIGEHCIINTGATVDHDCRLDNYVHLAPGVRLAGAVRLDEGVFCGIGTVAIPGAHVGTWSVIGAGGTIISDIPPHTIAVGTPARPKGIHI